MKLKVFTKPVKEEAEVYLRLIEDEFGNSVDLIACDSKGKRLESGLLLEITAGEENSSTWLCRPFTRISIRRKWTY